MIRLSDEQGQFLVGFLVGDMGEPFRSLRDHLQQQLDAPDHQEDLIETIASIVNSSTAKVAMPNVFVDALRRAILSPRELSRLKALKDTHQKCGSCERELQSGEMVSLHNQLPLCIACRTPTSYACPKCHGKIGMPTGIMRIIKKSIVECATCPSGVPAEVPFPQGAERAPAIRLGGDDVPRPMQFTAFDALPVEALVGGPAPRTTADVVRELANGQSIGQWRELYTTASNPPTFSVDTNSTMVTAPWTEGVPATRQLDPRVRRVREDHR